MNKEKYLIHDLDQAEREHICAYDLLTRMAAALYYEDLKEAKLSAVDFLNTIKEIEKLQSRKVNHDKLVNVARELSLTGMDVAIIQRSRA
ncbi:hypothetical protein ACFFIX_06470 [Metabacillus herbersteinensis]|uniref:Uncharacterized protein n=1 Tax=Metabacillus herbersteinensis TaxID=283816 RepID=A0ABV6GBY9_9BACI